MTKTRFAFVVPFVLALILYSYALSLPFFADDAPHYRFLQTVEDVPSLWLGQTWSPYYRPVVYTLWHVMTRVQGGFDATAQHAVNVLLFAVSSGLVGVLSGLLWRRVVVGVLAGCAFALFPFHYQAVNLIGSLTHLAVTTALLASLLFGVLALQNKANRPFLVACWIFALLANFSHETGFLVSPFLLGVLWLFSRFGTWHWRNVLLILSFPSAISAFYLVLWLRLPRTGGSSLSLSVSLFDNLAVLLQPFVFPFSALLRPFVEGKGSPLLLIALFSVSVAIGLIFVAWRQRVQLRVALGGLAWYGITIMPSVLFLTPSYVWSSPRLTVLASVGAIIFWGSVLQALWVNGRLGRVLVGSFVLWVALVSTHFLMARQQDYALMSDYTHALMTLVRAQNVAETGLLLVNAPNYIEPLQANKTFLVGAEFASFMSPEIDYRDYFAVNTGLDFSRVTVDAVGVGRLIDAPTRQFVPYFPMVDGDALYQLLRPKRPIFMTQFEGERFFPRWVGNGGAGDGQIRSMASLVRFNDTISLLKAVAQYDPLTQEIVLETTWQTHQPSAVKLFVHVVCDGALIAQSDGFLWGNLYPFSQHQPEETHTDRRTLRVIGYSPDCLNVLIGVYNEVNGGRLTAKDPQNGAIFADDAVNVPLLRESAKP